MKLLLDTQIFIWWDSESKKLPASILGLCQDEANSLVLSVASVYPITTRIHLIAC
jgi:PIN domain nuclease of toxin-antitoxin system